LTKPTKVKFLLEQQGYHIVNFMHRTTCAPNLICYDIDTKSKWMEADCLDTDGECGELIIVLRRTEDSIKGLGKFRLNGINSDTILRIVDPKLNANWKLLGIHPGKYGPRVFVAYLPELRAAFDYSVYCPLTKARKKTVIKHKKSASRLCVKQQ
jgi:hypothetical protein